MKNQKYIFKKSYIIFTVIVSIWGLIPLVTSTDKTLDFIESEFWRIIIAVLIFLFIYFFCLFSVLIFTIIFGKRVKVMRLNTNHSLYVEFGDLFKCGKSNERKNISFAVNRCFDTIVDNDLVGDSTLHGKALKRIYKKKKRNSDTINKEIQDSLSKNGYKKEELSINDKRSGNLDRYEIGAVAEISGVDNECYFMLGLTYFDKRLRANVDKHDYIKAISSLIKYISDRSQGYSTYISVIGAGCSDVGTVNELIVFIINTIKLYKDKINCDIHIIIDEKEKENGMGLFDLK